MLSASSKSSGHASSGGSSGSSAVAHPLAPAELAIDPATILTIESDIEPRWGKFLRHWETLAASKGGMPSRADIDPAALGGRLLPNVFIVDVLNGGVAKLRFRFRLLGQSIMDREATRPGAYLDQIGGTADIAAIERQYRAAIEGRVEIRHATLVWSDARKDMFKYSVMVLPLSEDGESVTNLIGLAPYEF